MNCFILALVALVVIVAGVTAGMDCGIAGNCPNIFNKAGDSITGQNTGKDFCCRVGKLDTPYCCDATDYAKYNWNRAFGSATSVKVAAGTTLGAAFLAMIL